MKRGKVHAEVLLYCVPRNDTDDGHQFGSQWWCLNGTMAQWIIDYLNEHMEYEKFFEHSLCPDECFFQTLVMNSPFAGSVKPYLHYIKWEKVKVALEH